MMDILDKSFDLWELANIVEKDCADDGRLEKATVQTAAKYAGEMIGEGMGNVAGIPLDVAAGFAVGGPPGAAVGAVAVPILASAVLSELNGLLAEYLAGETYDWEYPIELINERWK